jgi:hypothetical protein
MLLETCGITVEPPSDRLLCSIPSVGKARTNIRGSSVPAKIAPDYDTEPVMAYAKDPDFAA